MKPQSSFFIDSTDGVLKTFPAPKSPICGGKPFCCEGRRCDALTFKENYEQALELAKKEAVPVDASCVKDILEKMAATEYKVRVDAIQEGKVYTINSDYDRNFRLSDYKIHKKAEESEDDSIRAIFNLFGGAWHHCSMDEEDAIIKAVKEKFEIKRKT